MNLTVSSGSCNIKFLDIPGGSESSKSGLIAIQTIKHLQVSAINTEFFEFF